MRKRSLWKNALAGAAGGLVASFAMNQFQTLMKAAEKKLQPEKQQPAEGGDDATVKTAQAITRGVASYELKEHEKKPAGAVVHYVYGTLIGAVYGMLSSRSASVAAARGAAYGAAAWLGGDEIAVPAFGLGKAPSEVPASSHFKEFAAHLVYGTVTDGVARLLAGSR